MQWPEILTWAALIVNVAALVKWFTTRRLVSRDMWLFGVFLLSVLIFRLATSLALYEGVYPRWSVGVLMLLTAILVFISVLRLSNFLINQRARQRAVELARAELAQKLATEESLAMQLAKQLVNTRQELDYYKDCAKAAGSAEYSSGGAGI